MNDRRGADKPPPTVRGAVRNLRHIATTSLILHNSHFVSIAAVNGACAGAGLSWACACDIRLASENALFRGGFLTAGLSGDFGGSWTLPRIVGPAKAREIYILNEKIRAQEALRIGLVSKVIAARGNAFQAAVQKIAQRLANEAPLALLRIKANFLDSDKNTSFAEHLDVETERHAKCGYHPDAMEAGKAFLSKRKPKFSNVGENRSSWEMSRL